MAKRQKPAPGSAKQDGRLFTLAVFIISGPMTEKFVKKNKVISRTIQIRAAQSLEVLHYAMFGAFGREDEHMYEFQVGGNRPMDPKAKRYVLPMARGDTFGYWFDFGDDWWHQIDVVAIEDKVPRGVFPIVTKRVGKNPPQYIDWD